MVSYLAITFQTAEKNIENACRLCYNSLRTKKGRRSCGTHCKTDKTAIGLARDGAWQPNEEHLRYTPEQLLDCYIRSVGRNSNLLLGMAISRDGDFQDEAQFREFGKLIRKTYSNPIRLIDRPALADGCCEIRFDDPQPVRYLMLREDIRDGQRIREFRILADGKQVYESACVGHKRIVRFDNLTAKTIAVEKKALRSPFEGAALFCRGLPRLTAPKQQPRFCCSACLLIACSRRCANSRKTKTAVCAARIASVNGGFRRLG